MALSIKQTPEQRDAWGRAIAHIFNLNSVEYVTTDWSMESVSGGKALLQIQMVKVIDRETAEALLNGRDLPTAETEEN